MRSQNVREFWHACTTKEFDRRAFLEAGVACRGVAWRGVAYAVPCRAYAHAFVPACARMRASDLFLHEVPLLHWQLGACRCLNVCLHVRARVRASTHARGYAPACVHACVCASAIARSHMCASGLFTLEAPRLHKHLGARRCLNMRLREHSFMPAAVLALALEGTHV